MIYAGIIFAMDKEIVRKLDLSKRELPVWRAPVLSCENFDHLVANNAIFLKSLVAQERAGNYCVELHRAIAVLQKKKSVFDEENVASVYSPEAVRSIRMITRRDNDRAFLIEALKAGRYDGILKICRTNPYAVDAYALYLEYGGIAAPLHYALWYYVGKNEQLQLCIDDSIRYLLTFGANANGLDCDRNTPLHKVSTQEHIQYLWDRGAQNDIKNSEGLTPVMTYIKNNKQDLALFLLRVGRANLTLRDNQASTLLHYAVAANHAQLVDYLLCNGADFDTSNTLGETPGQLARGSNHQVKNLVEQHMLLHFCNALLADRGYAVEQFIEKYPWIDYTLALSWAEKFCYTKKFDNTYEMLESLQAFRYCLEEQRKKNEELLCQLN
ncbi:MAG TPA: ankyrin repeat domain-containing protein [Candidatus Babeliales bacterium]|nr:ankyrin repeat domain-containing protein [Candidatus Babeliales bacterium]